MRLREAVHCFRPMNRRLRVVLAALIMAACRSGGFAPVLPPALPDVSAWEKSSGRADFDDPPGSVEYELYVAPHRQGVYSVTRYRITPGRGAASEHEKLQWDEDGRKVHRYACVPQPHGGACRWQEFAKGSLEYDRELPSLLAVYRLHALLLRQRDARRAR
jgi:hypothetical protein